jgi:ABC transport system ATP-binding/permease protein
MGAPNVLILDEPTNDLDVQTLAVLEDYLEDFSGCAIAVSHDRYFLDRTVDTIFAFEEGGKIRQFPGNYSVYLDYKKAEEEKQQQSSPTKEKVKNETVNTTPESQENETKKKRGLSNWEKREFEQLEKKIAQLETEKAEAEKAMTKVPPGNYSQVQALYEQIETLKQAIDTATERWLELAERES